MSLMCHEFTRATIIFSGEVTDFLQECFALIASCYHFRSRLISCKARGPRIVPRPSLPPVINLSYTQHAE